MDTITDRSASSWLALLRTRRFFVVFLLGFSSGLPLALTGTALEARYASSNVSLTAIGFVTLVGLPYVFKFLWAPLLDRYVLPILGRRRGWMLLTQSTLLLLLLLMAAVQVDTAPLLLALLAVAVAFLSASQDIAIDAYRTDLFLPAERALGISFFVAAYRAAMLFSGSIGLILADQLGWQITYLVMALAMLIGIFATLLAENTHSDHCVPQSLKKAYLIPLLEFMQRPAAWLILLLLLTYKFGDVFAVKLMTTFFVRGLGFSMTEIGTVNKLGGFVAMLLGVFIAGMLMTRIRLFTALLYFGLLQMLSNCMFVLLAAVGKNTTLFIATVMIENFCGGLGNAAFLALIMSLCNSRYSAAQYALFTALIAVPREILGPLAAYLVQQYGWQSFYEISVMVSLPGLLVLCVLKKLLPRSAHSVVALGP